MAGKIVTAGMVAIGDELLSGRTRDRNIGHLAATLTLAGIELREVRIVGDIEAEIVAAVNALRQRYDHVFTSGGIGPTHDDITADAIGAAFGAPVSHDPAAMELLGTHYANRELEFTDARKRMARLPEGATMIENRLSVAPGFSIGNVHVMAGVPSIFEAMLDALLPGIEGGTKLLARSVHSPFPEGQIGGPLGEIQKRHPETTIGSYPRFEAGNFSTEIVIRSRDEERLLAAEAEVVAMISTLGERR
jgi:molybdenum cofactor synthesis domain-containing protein